MRKTKNTTKHRARRESAKRLLEEQLKRGTKPEKIDGKTTSIMIPLSESDKTRIKREIDGLNNPQKKSNLLQ